MTLMSQSRQSTVHEQKIHTQFCAMVTLIIDAGQDNQWTASHKKIPKQESASRKKIPKQEA